MPFNYTTIVPLYDSSDDVITANVSTATQFTKQLILELRQDVDYLGELTGITGPNWTSNHFNWTSGTSIALLSGPQIWMSYIKDLRTACEDLYTEQSLGSPTWTIGTGSLIGLWNNNDEVIPGNETTHTKRKVSIITDIRTALIAVADSLFYFVDSVNGNDAFAGTKGAPFETWNQGVSTVNSSGGNLFFELGTYSMVTQLTRASTIIDTAGLLQALFHNPSASAYPISASTPTLNNFLMVTQNNTYYNRLMDGSSNNPTLNNCIFFQAATNNPNGFFFIGDDPTFNHCAVMGNDRNTDGILLNGNNATLNNMIFLDVNDAIRYGIGASGTTTENNCGFYDYDNQHAGTVPTIVQNNNLFTDPLISDKTTGYLNDDSPYIDQATDPTKDIGAWEDGPYNILLQLSDSISFNDATVDKHKLVFEDSIKLNEDLDTSTINIITEMLFGGLFNSSTLGAITYLNTGDITVSDNPNFSYSGAALDISFDNPTGARKELYITVDDGVTDYNSLPWWEINAYKNDDPNRNFAGFTTGTWIIDAWKEALTGNEFGEGYEFSTVTSDGVNDQQADITLKYRVRDYVTGSWSELMTVTKTYDFNDFDKTMYYCADNPRAVNGEYANHANYLAQPYHTGTTKYTRPDGVDWEDDNRRYAYNPAFKMSQHLNFTATNPAGNAYVKWQDRKMGSLQPSGLNSAMTQMMLYACIFTNYMNWNDSGDHCFADTTHQPFDKGDATLTNPVLGDGDSDLHYILMTAYEGSDCSGHGSQTSIIFRAPSSENITWGEWSGFNKVLEDAGFYFAQGDNPQPSCSGNKYYFWSADNTGAGYPGDFIAWMDTHQEFYANTNSLGNLEYGTLSFRKIHTGGNESLNSIW